MMILWAVVAYAIGALPLGHRAARSLSGQEPRWASAYNLGLENSLRLLGSRAVLAAFLVDLIKGHVAVSLARGTGFHGAMLAGVAVYLGHLYPLPGRAPLRARGAGVLFGVLGGLVTAGFPVPYAVLTLAAALVVYGLAGYASLAAVTLPLALALVASFLEFSLVAKLLAWALLALALWRYKENLGRILDGIEPRLGQPLPLPSDGQVVCAFLIHPMTLNDLWQSRRFRWMRAPVERGLVPKGWVEKLTERFRPMKMGELSGVRTGDGREIRCYLLSAPLLPEQITRKPELAVRRAIQAARLARALGATTIGLGAFWSVVGEKGSLVQEAVPEIHVTNGGAFTAGTVKASIPRILSHYRGLGKDLKEITAAVVGASGVVAFGIARQVAPLVGKLILWGAITAALSVAPGSCGRRIRVRRFSTPPGLRRFMRQTSSLPPPATRTRSSLLST